MDTLRINIALPDTDEAQRKAIAIAALRRHLATLEAASPRDALDVWNYAPEGLHSHVYSRVIKDRR